MPQESVRNRRVEKADSLFHRFIVNKSMWFAPPARFRGRLVRGSWFPRYGQMCVGLRQVGGRKSRVFLCACVRACAPAREGKEKYKRVLTSELRYDIKNESSKIYTPTRAWLWTPGSAFWPPLLILYYQYLYFFIFFNTIYYELIKLSLEHNWWRMI